MNITEKIQCLFFKGDKPCVYHKKEKVHCNDCRFYNSVSKKILIIKLGAAGDVIRTTPLLHKVKEMYPKAEITWLTYFPRLVPSIVDNIVDYNLQNVIWLMSCRFDFLFNLDKEREAIGLASLVKAKVKKGFTVKDCKTFPFDKDAAMKWRTGIWDDVEATNRKSYPEEIFEICGLKYNKEKYIIDRPGEYNWKIGERRPLVGLNIGCGSRWPTRAWPTENWIHLIEMLKRDGLGTILLGGEAEDEKNKQIAGMTKAAYLGHFGIEKFISLVDQCDAVITSVTMALHIAIAVEKKIVLLNNIFDAREFELYGLGEVVEPSVECIGCYRSECEKKCMESITPEKVYQACRRVLNY